MRITLLVFFVANSFAYSQQWSNDLAASLKRAAQQDKKVLLYFSVPEAFNVCEQLEKNIWESVEFKDYSREKFILVKPDFKESASFETKAENLLIVEKYNKDGFFPLVVILDKNAKVLGKTGLYNDETPQEYITLLQSLAK